MAGSPVCVEWIPVDEVVERATTAGVAVPIELTPAFARFQDDSPGRRTVAGLLVRRGEEDLAVGVLTRVDARWGHYLWLRHGPVWLSEVTLADERAVVEEITRAIRERDRRALFLRLDASSDIGEDAMGLVVYDETAIIDTSVTDPEAPADEREAEILARFKSRGRRDVRKSIRESGLECADETARAVGDFSEYQAVMEETAARDGFTPWDEATYRRMLTDLGPERAMLYAGRLDGEVVCWSLVTISGRHAQRHYAAMATSAMRKRVGDRLLMAECVELSGRGVEAHDLMGVGSESQPSLMGLNEFKLKFTAGPTPVRPTRDVMLRPLAARGVRDVRRLLAEGVWRRS